MHASVAIDTDNNIIVNNPVKPHMNGDVDDETVVLIQIGKMIMVVHKSVRPRLTVKIFCTVLK